MDESTPPVTLVLPGPKDPDRFAAVATDPLEVGVLSCQSPEDPGNRLEAGAASPARLPAIRVASRGGATARHIGIA